MTAGQQITLDTTNDAADTAAANDSADSAAATPAVPHQTDRRTRSGLLVALSGGPRTGQWFWRADWRLLRQSVQAQFPPGHPAAVALHYRPTGICVQNPNGTYGWGELWRHDPPVAAAGRAPGHVTLSTGEKAALCPRCARPAPRLITYRLAHLPAPARECPRCVYPDQQAMPTADQYWYATHPAAVEADPPVAIPHPRQPAPRPEAP